MINAMEMYSMPIEPDEVNLVDLIAEHIKQAMGDESSLIFLNDEEIAAVHQINPVVQRITINKYINSILLIFTSITNINVNDILQFTSNDGLNEDWITLIKEFIMPFFTEHNVIQTTYLFKIGEL